MECILEQRSTYERFRDYAEERLLHSLKEIIKHFNIVYIFKYQQYLVQYIIIKTN